MAWKKIYEGEVQQVTKDTTGLVGKQALFSLGLDGFVGKRVRVTVEEEVGECCEKWQGPRNVYRPTDFDPLLADYTAKFCPECGRKLS